MANWTGVSRTNYFQVKDVAAFIEEMERYPVDLLESKQSDGSTHYGLGAESNEGSWPITDENDEEVDFPSIVANHLADGEVAVFVSAGSEKSRYVTGHACAIDNTGQSVHISIDDIYIKAKEVFGSEPSPAEY